MSTITLCKPFEISGGQDPQSVEVNADISSDNANTSQVTGYYTINGGAQMGLQTFPASGQVSGQTYAETVSGLNTGDVVRICVGVDIATTQGDTGQVDFNAALNQVAGDGCEKSYSISALCNWEAVSEMIAPDCSNAPNILTCENLPITFNIPNGTAIQSIEPPLIDYLATINSSTGDLTITANVSGQGGSGTHVFTILGTGMTCQFTVDIEACESGSLMTAGPSCPTSIIPESNVPVPQIFGPYFASEGGVAPYTVVVSGLSQFATITTGSNGSYIVTVPENSSPTPNISYTVTVTDANNQTFTCEDNEFEISGF